MADLDFATERAVAAGHVFREELKKSMPAYLTFSAKTSEYLTRFRLYQHRFLQVSRRKKSRKKRDPERRFGISSFPGRMSKPTRTSRKSWRPTYKNLLMVIKGLKTLEILHRQKIKSERESKAQP